MNIMIGGALGRMGQEVAKAAEAAGMTIACGVDVAYQGQAWGFPMAMGYDRAREEADVLVDFSRPDGLPELLAFCKKRQMPCVLCTTGYTDVELRAIRDATGEIAVLRSANMSLGVNVMQRLVSMATKALGDGFDIEIIEKHHRMKADSPSGTALMLYESAKEAAGVGKPIYGRYGRREVREKGDIGLHAVRGGTVTGEHEVGFYGEGEHILLIHRAESRALFAQGAIKAARFLAGKPAGFYTMQDVVAEMLA